MENKLAKTEPPKVFFQYRPPKDWAVDNLSRRVLFFGSPASFNDPYDCGIPPRLRSLTDENLQSNLDSLAQRRNLSLRPVSKGDGGKFVGGFNTLSPERWHQMRDPLGVACFSASKVEYPDNLPMWSHYGGHGEGFCLAFDTQKEPFVDKELIREVCYSDDLPNGDTLFSPPFGKLDNLRKMLDYLAHKAKNWKYENEWRVFRRIDGENEEECKKNREIGYDLDALKAIYFGTEAKDETKVHIRSIVRYVYPHTELWQGRLSNTEYKVEFDRIG